MHRRALEAEYLAWHPSTDVLGVCFEALESEAAELRAHADDVFEQLIRQQAFGSLAPMPQVKRSS